MKIFLRLPFYTIFCAMLLLSACEKQGNSSAADSASAGAGGSLARFAISGNYLYTVDSHMLTVYDITNPALPVNKGQVYAGFDIETIFPFKDKLMLGASNGLYIYSIADPVKPVKESSITHFRACDPVVTNDTISYVTLRSGNGSCGSLKNVLNVYDIKDSKAPKLVKEIDLKSPYGLGIKQKALYICEADNGLGVFSLADPYNPKKIAEFKDDLYYDVIPYGDILIAYIDKGVSFFDITDPLNIVKAGTVSN
ncbi:MAG: hypothetical protein ABIQ88_22300 [Chitinophagaceae bacterium]